MNIFILIILGCLSLSQSLPAQTEEKSKSTERGRSMQSDLFISRGKRLLEWNKEKLTSRSDLCINDIKELFAPEFVVIANGRKYDANYQNYYDFLNKFRSNIDTIDYEVQEYLSMDSTIVMPLKAIVKRLQGEQDIFDAILLIKFNDSGKIVHWQEVYSVR